MAAFHTPWLFTDERLGSRLFEAISNVPDGGGVMYRHDSEPGRAKLGAMVADVARRRGLALGVAGDVALAERLGADFVHRPSTASDLPVSMPVHDEVEAHAARTLGAALIFVSPVLPTRSHPGAPALGVEEATRLARLAGCPAIALGGMHAAAFDALPSGAFAGWAGIDAFLA